MTGSIHHHHSHSRSTTLNMKLSDDPKTAAGVNNNYSESKTQKNNISLNEYTATLT